MGSSKPVEEQWGWILSHPNADIRKIAAQASTKPDLRSLFPFPSHSDLRFSQTTTYPYDWDLPFIRTYEEQYQAMDGVGKVIFEGELDMVVEYVANAMHLLLQGRS